MRAAGALIRENGDHDGKPKIICFYPEAQGVLETAAGTAWNLRVDVVSRLARPCERH
jgi:hypothetical protein